MKVNVRPSHIEAYQDEILSESAMFIPQSDTLEGIMTESAICIPVTESIDQLLDYAKERSQNVQLVADMFKLDSIECSLCENATRMNIKIDDNTKVNIPIESAIQLQYSDILNSIKMKRM